VADFSRSYYVPIPYTLSDEDVTVTEGIITACSFTIEERDIIIPDTLYGQAVKGIADQGATNGVFYEKPFKTVRFPSTMEYIGDGAFRKSNLISIDLSACNSLQKIGRSAFLGNDLTMLDFGGCNNLKVIGAGAFNDNDITTIDFQGCPDLSIIGEHAFDSNLLIEIDLTSCAALMRLDRGAFLNNTLNSIILPENTQYAAYGWKDNKDSLFEGSNTIDELAYYYYVPFTYVLQDPDVEIVEGVIRSSSYPVQFRQISVPEILNGQAVTGISDMDHRMAFASNGIVSVDLPASVEMIGEGAFFQNDLKSVELAHCTSLTVIGLNAFLANDSLDHLVLPVPQIPGFSFHDWTDNWGTRYAGGDTVKNFAAEYAAVLEPTGESPMYKLEDLSLFPNPASGIIHIHLPWEAEVSVLDMNGKILDEYSFTEGDWKIPLVRLESGVYLFRIAAGDITISRRIVVQ
jgi:hypothetical protein